MPSVTIRLVSARDTSSADTEAQALDFDLDVWDRYELGGTLGRPRAVMGHIRRILHLQPLAVPGIDIIGVRCVSARGPARDPDELALHGTVSVTVLAGHEASLA